MIFVLGIERSATTWVANILDHHPRLDVYMEPLSIATTRFKRWPQRFDNIENHEELARYFNEEFEELKRHRKFLLSRFSDSAKSWRTDLRWAQKIARKWPSAASATDFLQLNFHRKNRRFSVAKEEPLQTVIKEVRLNFNAGLVSELARKVQVIVVIREMASCVRSMLGQMNKGNLVELKSDLAQRYREINPESLCSYWLESYSALFEHLQDSDINFKIAGHSDLLYRPDAAVKDMLGFLNLKLHPTVNHYLSWSDQSGSGKHSTMRSRQQLMKQMRKDREQIYPRVEKKLEQISRHPVLKRFISLS